MELEIINLSLRYNNLKLNHCQNHWMYGLVIILVKPHKTIKPRIDNPTNPVATYFGKGLNIYRLNV